AVPACVGVAEHVGGVIRNRVVSSRYPIPQLDDRVLFTNPVRHGGPKRPGLIGGAGSRGEHDLTTELVREVLRLFGLRKRLLHGGPIGDYTCFGHQPSPPSPPAAMAWLGVSARWQ